MPNETTPTIIRRYYPTLSSIINSDGYYFENGVLKFKRPRIDVLIDTIIKVKIRIYIENEFIESNERTFLLKH